MSYRFTRASASLIAAYFVFFLARDLVVFVVDLSMDSPSVVCNSQFAAILTGIAEFFERDDVIYISLQKNTKKSLFLSGL